MANLEYDIPISAHSVFDIGSNSKQFTAMCIFLLTRQNLLTLDDELQKHIPEIPQYSHPIILRHLSCHTSGILGKFAACTVFIGAIVIGAPSIVVYIYAVFAGLPASISIGNYCVGVVMVYLMVLFVLALTILLGVIFDRITAVTVLALTIFFSGASLLSSQIRWLKPYTVWALQHNAYETMSGNAITWWAIFSAVISMGLLLLLAIGWLKRSEL